MNRQTRVALFAFLFIAIIAVVGVLVLKPNPDEQFAPRTEQAQNNSEIESEGTKGETGRTATAPGTELTQGTVTSQQQSGSEGQQLGIVELADNSAAQPNPFEDKIFFNPDDMAELLEQYGSYSAIYKLANDEQRRDLIDVMVSNEALRGELAAILPLEQNSVTRAYILERTEPKGLFDDSDSISFEDDMDIGDFIDEELKDLLDAPPGSDIEQQEWMARIELANLMDSQYALQWIRDGRQVFPDDPSVNMLASTLLLTLAQGVDGVTQQETTWATDYITDALGGANREQFSADQRIRAYYAMYFGKDQGRSYQFLQNQMAQESDPKAQNVLKRLVDRMQQRGDMASVK